MAAEMMTVQEEQTTAIKSPEIQDNMLDLFHSDVPGAGLDEVGEDILLPRILLAQAMTPQRKKSDPSYVERLEEGDFFNSVTGQIYGNCINDVTVVRYVGKRAIEFSDGDIVDANVPLDDARCKWTTSPQGERIPPIATIFLDYLFYLGEHEEFVTWSAKSTSIREAKRLNYLMKCPIKTDGQVIRNPPSWARTFKLTSVETRGDISYFAPRFMPVGITPPAIREECAQMFASYANERNQ